VGGQPLLHQDLSANSLVDAWNHAIAKQEVTDKEAEHCSTSVSLCIRDVQNKTSPMEPAFRTTLLDYQRSTVTRMIFRENAIERKADMSMSRFHTANGTLFYMDVEGVVKLVPAQYNLPNGGILADLPGSGKTLTTLALMAFTKGQHAQLRPSHEHNLGLHCPILSKNSKYQLKVGSLTEACIRRAVFHGLALADDLALGSLADQIRTTTLYYKQPRELASYTAALQSDARPKRAAVGRTLLHVPVDALELPTQDIRLSKTSLYVVPDTLIGSYQWENELKKHFTNVAKGAIAQDNPESDSQIRYTVLTSSMDNDKFPSVEEIAGYDAILMSQLLFQKQQDNSPLLRVHFKRVIIDEGHFAGSENRSTAFASQLLTQARWIVTATPTKNLNHTNQLSGEERVSAITQNGYEGINKDAIGDLQKLGKIAACLALPPYDNDPIAFNKSITYPFVNGYGYKRLQNLMSQVVIRNNPDLVHQQMHL